MDRYTLLGPTFEAERRRLRGVAYRMLGSAAEADDAVQEAWLRLARSHVDAVENLSGWLTTVVSRVCLDMLRSRSSRREQALVPVPGRGADEARVGPGGGGDDGGDPAEEAELVESVGRALLVVLDRLSPAERVAFVLHDLFAVPFEQVALLVDRTPVAAKKLASRARRRVNGTPVVPVTMLVEHRRVVDAFLTAARGGDVEELLTVLAPDVVRRADLSALRPGEMPELRGARTVANETAGNAAGARVAAVALIDGEVGLLVVPDGHLAAAITFTIADGTITAMDVVAHPDRLASLDLAVLPVPD